MNHPRSARLVLELVVSVLFFVAAVLTALVPDWLERTIGVSPDAGSGAAEWLIVGVLFAVAAACALDFVGGLKRLRQARQDSSSESSPA